jgi:hypothetical protein
MVGAPVAKGTKPSASPAAPSAPGQQKPGAAQAAPKKKVLTVMEKGREVQYGSPEDFLERTTLTPPEIAGFSHKKMDEAKKDLDAANARGDKAAADRAMAEIKLAERLDALAKARIQEGPEKSFIYSSLGKRDPFMSQRETDRKGPGRIAGIEGDNVEREGIPCDGGDTRWARVYREGRRHHREQAGPDREDIGKEGLCYRTYP